VLPRTESHLAYRNIQHTYIKVRNTIKPTNLLLTIIQWQTISTKNKHLIYPVKWTTHLSK